MQADLQIPLHSLHAFVLVMMRVGGVFLFTPVPGVRNAPAPARAVLSAALALALYPKWPKLQGLNPDMGQLIFWSLSELALGVTVGLLIALVLELFAIGAQAVSLPAGYTYASAVDPATQAESNVLVILAQLTSGLLFFAFDLHHQLIALLARSLETYPPGQFAITAPVAEHIVRAGSVVFQLGLGLVLPILALMAMIDISLSLLGRLNAQLQVITLSFPLKIAISLVVLAAFGPIMPRLFHKTAGEAMTVLRTMLLT
jgi:flagellar biosynthetic protein FliR